MSGTARRASSGDVPLAAVSTYVVGLDGSEHARAALKWAEAVGTDDDRVIAVHAWEIPIVTGYEAVAAVDTTAVEQAAKEFLDGHDQRGATIRGSRAASSPAIPGAPSSRWPPTLGEGAVIVVGHDGSSKAALLLGSTANYVMHHTKAPVVVVRGACRVPVRRVVVGIDDPHGHEHLDPPSLAALRWAVELAGVERVEVHHSAFVPTMVAGPLSQPGAESEDAEQQDARLLRETIALATGGVRRCSERGRGRPRDHQPQRRLRPHRGVPGGRSRRGRITRAPRADRADRRVDEPRGHRPLPLPGRRPPLTSVAVPVCVTASASTAAFGDTDPIAVSRVALTPAP